MAEVTEHAESAVYAAAEAAVRPETAADAAVEAAAGDVTTVRSAYPDDDADYNVSLAVIDAEDTITGVLAVIEDMKGECVEDERIYAVIAALKHARAAIMPVLDVFETHTLYPKRKTARDRSRSETTVDSEAEAIEAG